MNLVARSEANMMDQRSTIMTSSVSFLFCFVVGDVFFPLSENLLANF